MREALRARVDCPLSALPDRRDKETVTVGGIIVEAKRIRTRNGDQMMFATLDDLSGAVEVLVFGGALTEHEAALAVDEVVLVKGRVDHKEAGKTCVVAQTVERFAPSEQEIERARAQARVQDRATVAVAPKPREELTATTLTDGRVLVVGSGTLDGAAADADVYDPHSGTWSATGPMVASRVQHTATLRAELEHALAPFASAATG